MELLVKIVKFVLGWMIWIIVFVLSIAFSVLTWNWKETLSLDMEKVMKQLCGKSTWKVMTFNKL